MRQALLLSIILVALGAGTARAGSAATPDNVQQIVPAGFETYRGYMFDLRESAGRKDLGATVDNLKRQLDMVEESGLSPRVLRFFRIIPIIASEMACLDEGAAAACYGPVAPDRERSGPRDLTVWDHDKQQWSNPNLVDLAADSGLGVIMLRPNMMRHAKEPVMLHEFLHAYHARLLPNGYQNLGVKAFYIMAKAKNLLPRDSYAMKNQMEFFAVTASIFLSGKSDVHEPFTREKLKEKMPDHYKNLVGMFGFDPDAPSGPVASAN